MTNSSSQSLNETAFNLFEAEFFGVTRHDLIAEVAGTRLQSQNAKSQVRSLLDHLGVGSLGDLGGWADTVKRRSATPRDDDETRDFLNDARNRRNDTWHFVNLPLDVTAYDREQLPYFTSDEDVVQMSRHCIAVLQGQSDRFSRANALRLLVHLIGDIHQPIHVGCCFLERVSTPEGARLVRDPNRIVERNLQSDRGGNQLILPISGSRSLHSYWDSALGDTDHQHDQNDDGVAVADSVPSSAPSPTTGSLHTISHETRARYIAEVQALISDEGNASAQSDEMAFDAPLHALEMPGAWATQSLGAARSAYQSLEIDRPMSGGKYKVRWEGKEAYDARNRPIMKKQIANASTNLALLLDAIWP